MVKFNKIVFLCSLAMIGFLHNCSNARSILGIADSAVDPKESPSSPGLTGAYLEVVEGASYNFGNVDILSSDEVMLTLYNSGVKTAGSIAVDTDLSSPFAFKGGTYPGTGGSCSTSLASESTCDIVLTYSPTAGGTFSDIFILAYDNDGTAEEFSFGVLGSSGVADVTTDKDPTLTFDNTLLGDSTDVTVVLSNGGDLSASYLTDAEVTTAPFGYKGGTYPGTGGTCVYVIAAGATCTVVLTYSPTAAGSHVGAWGLGFVTGGEAGAVSLILNGTSGTASLALSDGPEFDYGNVFVGVTSDKSFTLTNSGNYVAENLADSGLLSGDFDYKGGTYPGTGGDCGSSLAALDTCTIVITFTPTDGAEATGTLELDYNTGESDTTVSVDLVGVGQQALLEATVGTTYDFNRVAKNSTNEASITITNNGNYQATAIADTGGLSSPFRYKGFAYPGTGGTCTTSLSASASCTIVIQYIPTGSGTSLSSSSDSLTLNYTKGSGSGSMTLTVEGEAGLGSISTSGSSAWGNKALGSTATKTVTVSNNGTYDVSDLQNGVAFAAPFTYTTTGTFPGSGGTCSSDLAPGGSCTVKINYDPVIEQVDSDTLELSYNDGETVQTATKALTGTGTLAHIGISPTSYDFSTASYNNDVLTNVFTVTNSGLVSATGVTRTGLSAPFTIQSTTCTGTLTAGNSCTVTVAYTPTAIALDNDTLDINYTDGQGAQVESLVLDGEGINVVSVASDSAESVPVDDPGTPFTLVAADENGDSMTYTIVTPPTNGALGAVVGNSVTYTPNPLYTGPDSFTFHVHDGSGFSNTATVTITVTP